MCGNDAQVWPEDTYPAQARDELIAGSDSTQDGEE